MKTHTLHNSFSVPFTSIASRKPCKLIQNGVCLCVCVFLRSQKPFRLHHFVNLKILFFFFLTIHRPNAIQKDSFEMSSVFRISEINRETIANESIVCVCVCFDSMKHEIIADGFVFLRLDFAT